MRLCDLVAAGLRRPDAGSDCLRRSRWPTVGRFATGGAADGFGSRLVERQYAID